jgi:CheY-like chemotaxis protein
VLKLSSEIAVPIIWANLSSPIYPFYDFLPNPQEEIAQKSGSSDSNARKTNIFMWQDPCPWFSRASGRGGESMSEDECSVPEYRPAGIILCIDDEPNLLTIRQLLLSSMGYQVIGTATGGAGLELFKQEKIDLVITDHLLPDVSGVQVAAEMKRLHPDVPIILLTGLLEPPEGAENVDLFLTKGVSTQELIASVAKLMKRKREANGGDSRKRLGSAMRARL